MIRILRQRETGQAALETLVVFALWFVLTMLVVNVMLIIAALMLNQSTVTRGAQQAASLGCLHDGISEEIEERAFFGAKNVRVKAVVVRNAQELDPSSLAAPLADSSPRHTPLAPCGGQQAAAAPADSVVVVQATYDQHLALLGLLGLDAPIKDVTRTAAAVSNALEEGSS